MLKAVFRPNELVPLAEKIIIASPNTLELAHLMTVEETDEDTVKAEEYTGPTADDLRREAEAFRIRWEAEKAKMLSGAKAEADKIVLDAQKTASADVKRKNDEAQIIKQQAETEAKKIIDEANAKAAEMEKEMKQTLDAERKEALDNGHEEGHKAGFAEGKAEVDRLIERTQVMLERAQDKRGEILAETEKEIIDLVLLIARKIIKVISENQRNVIISNVVQALRKVKAKGDVIIRVNMSDLQLATERKQDFIKLMESAKSVQIIEDTTVDSGGCIIETDFGEIDARIASQLAELENKILEVSPIKSRIKNNTPPPVIRTANLNNDLAATSSLMDVSGSEAEEGTELSPAANAALTASAAIATMAAKGRRESDKIETGKIESIGKRSSDNPVM